MINAVTAQLADLRRQEMLATAHARRVARSARTSSAPTSRPIAFAARYARYVLSSLATVAFQGVIGQKYQQ